MSKKTNDALRMAYVTKLMEVLGIDEEVLRTGGNELAIPVVDADGEDSWVVITVKVPTGTRDGDIYDGYNLAETYKLHMEEKAAKAKKDADKKAAKIARDEKMRAQKAAAKAAHEEA